MPERCFTAVCWKARVQQREIVQPLSGVWRDVSYSLASSEQTNGCESKRQLHSPPRPRAYCSRVSSAAARCKSVGTCSVVASAHSSLSRPARRPCCRPTCVRWPPAAPPAMQPGSLRAAPRSRRVERYQRGASAVLYSWTASGVLAVGACSALARAVLTVGGGSGSGSSFAGLLICNGVGGWGSGWDGDGDGGHLLVLQQVVRRQQVRFASERSLRAGTWP